MARTVWTQQAVQGERSNQILSCMVTRARREKQRERTNEARAARGSCRNVIWRGGCGTGECGKQKVTEVVRVAVEKRRCMIQSDLP